MLKVARKIATSRSRNLIASIINRCCHNIKSSSNESERYWIRTGEYVLLPPKPLTDFTPDQVIAYGEEAVISSAENVHTGADRAREKNRLAYLRLRNNHLDYAEGLWCSVADEGQFVMFHEDVLLLYNSLELIIRHQVASNFGVSSAYVNCIGRECIVEGEDGVGGLGLEEIEIPQSHGVVPEDIVISYSAKFLRPKKTNRLTQRDYEEYAKAHNEFMDKLNNGTLSLSDLKPTQTKP